MENSTVQAKRRRAPIIDIWLEIVRNREISISRVAKDCDLDYKWLLDWFNDGKVAEQVIKVKKLDRYFKTEDLDIDRYRSEKIEQMQESELLK